MGVIFLSLGLHAAIIVAIGGVVVFRYFTRPPVQFKTPPKQTVQRIEPRKLEYQVRMQEQQKKSGRPTVSARMTAQTLGSLSLPQIKTDVKPSRNDVFANVTGFGGSGLGDGLGSGTGAGGLGLGMSSVSFFGVQDRGEKIAILVDVSASMLGDDKGGAPGFQAVKTELGKVVKSLNEGTFFNVIVFAEAVDLFQEKLVLANTANKNAAVQFIEPYNQVTAESASEAVKALAGSGGAGGGGGAGGKGGGGAGGGGGQQRGGTQGYNKALGVGTHLNNYRPSSEDMAMAPWGTTRLDTALCAAFEQGADAIFILTDGKPRVLKPLTDAQREENEKYREENSEAIDQARNQKSQQLANENRTRAEKGLAPKVLEEGAGLNFRPPHPQEPWSNQEMLAHVQKLVKMLYADKKLKPPHVHIVGYEITGGSDPKDVKERTDAATFLRSLANRYQGNFRNLNSLVKPIVSSEPPPSGRPPR